MSVTTLMVIPLVLLAGCTSTEPLAKVQVAGLSTIEQIPGYRHLLSHSRLGLGKTLTMRSESGVEKTIGENGVFGTLVSSGWAVGVPNANSALRSAAALSTSAEVHNAAVVDYFKGAGLPQDQIGSVNAHASIHMVAPGDDGIQAPPVFERYSTVISRSLNGIPIVESFAWAIINVNNDVVQESIYWPDIPRSVMSEAQALAQYLSIPANAVAYKNALPMAFPGGRVAIHHTPCLGGIAETVATYDVTAHGIGMARERHFDSGGREVILAADSRPILPHSRKRN